jgi:hypothetical protein
MIRVATKDIGRNVRRGQIYDWPLTTWKAVANSAGVPLDLFSELADEAAKRMAARGRRNDDTR